MQRFLLSFITIIIIESWFSKCLRTVLEYADDEFGEAFLILKFDLLLSIKFLKHVIENELKDLNK